MEDINENTLICDCGLSVRAHNVLYINSEKMGIPNNITSESPLAVKDLKKISLSDLRSFRQCGNATVSEIIALAKKVGIELKQN